MFEQLPASHASHLNPRGTALTALSFLLHALVGGTLILTSWLALPDISFPKARRLIVSPVVFPRAGAPAPKLGSRETSPPRSTAVKPPPPAPQAIVQPREIPATPPGVTPQTSPRRIPAADRPWVPEIRTVSRTATPSEGRGQSASATTAIRTGPSAWAPASRAEPGTTRFPRSSIPALTT